MDSAIGDVQKAGASREIASAPLRARLQARRPEIEEAVLARLHGISGSSQVGGPEHAEYVEGLQAAISAALDYGLEAIERAERGTARPVPVALLAQARRAARSGVSLDTVLRRYFAGYTLLADFLLEEGQQGDLLPPVALKRLLRTLAPLFDRLLAAVSEEYAREAQGRPGSAEERRIQLVRRLLDGELLDVSELAYDLDANHLGLLATGPGAAEAARRLAASLDRRLLVVRPEEETVWAWLGSRRPTDPGELERLAAVLPPEISLAIGEPGEGLAGWRLSHRQAAAALPLARRGPGLPVRYRDVALLASMLQDDLLTASLHRLYLAPLEQERDRGEVARRTLRAYFAAGRNVSSAAASLGVDRNTVANRLHAVEETLGRPLGACATDLNAALELRAVVQPPERHAWAPR